jgi:GcrA cell cycle regulator
MGWVTLISVLTSYWFTFYKRRSMRFNLLKAPMNSGIERDEIILPADELEQLQRSLQIPPRKRQPQRRAPAVPRHSPTQKPSAESLPHPGIREVINPKPTLDHASSYAFMRIGLHDCCWPIGRPGDADFRFCGLPAVADLQRFRLFGQLPGRNKLKVADSRLSVSPFPEIKFILSCCGVP